MYRIGWVLLCCTLWACGGNDDKGKDAKTGESGQTAKSAFGSQFKSVSLPYELSDTALLKNKDTTTLQLADLPPLLPDSTNKKLFGKAKTVKYVPLAKVEAKNKESYYVVKATGGDTKAALLLVFDKAGKYGATLPFLVPDEKSSTSQLSSIDKSYTITKAITERNGSQVTGEGKDVLAYDAANHNFSLVMTDLLNDDAAVLVNPIDTFPKTNRWTGDYYLNKKNLVAVRDGRHSNQILVYIHTENSEGDCKGELKGEFILTSSSTAVYRQGGDPCILGLSFSGNNVSIREESGCGNYRGLNCPLDGTFARKKEEKKKEATKKPKRQ